MDWSPTADWQPLRNENFRKVELYKLEWEVDLAKFRSVGAPFGGPVAILRDDSKVIQATPGSRPELLIYTRAGALLGRVPWSTNQRLVSFGWTNEETLVCVLENADVYVYDVHGQRVGLFNMGSEVQQQVVYDAIVWAEGVIVLTKEFALYTASGFVKPRIMRMADTMLDSPPTSWCMIEPTYTATGNVEVLLATNSGTILVVDSDRCHDQRLSNGPFTRMALSPGGQYIACFTATGDLWVTSSDFKKSVIEFKTSSAVPPQQLQWCGVHAVVMYFAPVLLVIGRYGDFLKFQYDVPLVLTGEMDGLCITSNQACELLQLVPAVTEAIFRIGSTVPSATLYDAFDHFERKNPKADDLIRRIRDGDELTDAVDNCIRAAAEEFNIRTQKALLKAASFGKCFETGYDPTDFVDTCRALRLMNAVRDASVGIPITFVQYCHLGPLVLIDRLINRHQHLLAFKLCEYLKLPTERVLIHWACAKVKTNGPSDVILSTIVEKLGPVAGVSYVEIASTANGVGNTELATRLLDYEPRAADQVPLLIHMRKEERALEKAIECGDTDLVYLVLLHMRRHKSPEEFLRIIHNKPKAFELMIKYCKMQDVPFLRSLYQQSGRNGESGHVTVMQAYAAPELSARLKRMSVALGLYEQDRSYSFFATQTKAQIDLTRFQVDLESTCPGESFLDLSLHDTVSKLVFLGQEQRASKAASVFKIPAKRFGCVKVQALARARRWDALEAFSRERKCPVGFGAFASACIEHGSNSEAVKYIGRIKEPSERASFYLSIERYKEAADCAAQARDTDILLQIRSACAGGERTYVEGILRQFQ